MGGGAASSRVPGAPGRPIAVRRGRLRARALLENRIGLVGAVIIALEILVALLAPVLSPHDPIEQHIARRLTPPGWVANGTWYYPLGTDQLGRDILSRIIYGSRVSLLVGFLSVAISLPLGVLIGLVAGYFGGKLDDLMMRIADTQLAFPFILLAITIVGVLGPTPRNVILILGIGGWVVYARVTRGQVLSLKEKDFIEAARGLGLSHVRMLLRHILPNTLTPLIVVATFAVAQMILLESSLSFLGLGIRPPTPSWGGMLNEGRNYITLAWWLSTFPGAAIMLTVLGINFVGDWLRDVLDPRLLGA